jgi:DNA-binding NarL/FixJ family response regulator
MDRPRVMLADNQRILREALAALLESHCQIVGTVSDGHELVAAAARLKPDIVVLEIALPRLNGVDAGRQLKGLLPRVKLVYLTVNDDPDVASELLQIGASGLLFKSSAGAELLQAIREVSQGRVYVTPLANGEAAGPRLHAPAPATRGTGLSTRRREVLRLLAEGHSMKQVARRLNLSPRTVAYHKYGMMEELGLRSNAKLIQYAIRRELVPA